jgi:L-asparagine transporter-like permease
LAGFSFPFNDSFVELAAQALVAFLFLFSASSCSFNCRSFSRCSMRFFLSASLSAPRLRKSKSRGRVSPVEVLVDFVAGAEAGGAGADTCS